MEVKIGARINNLRHKRNISVEELSEVLQVTEHHVYKILKKDDISVSQLWTLSEKLDYNFFELFKPVTSEESPKQKPTLESIKDLKKTKIDQEKLEVNFGIQYPPEVSDKLGQFILHVHVLADEMGIKLV
ncbi:MAG: helix-turn-helix domain-containing protein [Sphingobacteriaceae bacterium]